MNSKLVSKIISGTLLVSMVGYTLPVFAILRMRQCTQKWIMQEQIIKQ